MNHAQAPEDRHACSPAPGRDESRPYRLARPGRLPDEPLGFDPPCDTFAVTGEGGQEAGVQAAQAAGHRDLELLGRADQGDAAVVGAVPAAKLLVALGWEAVERGRAGPLVEEALDVGLG